MTEKYILVWDVGIKNLAFCLLLKKETIKIILWDKINITNSSKILCEHLLKNGKICNKRAIYEGLTQDNTVNYYCGKHKKAHEKKINLDEQLENEDKECEYEIKGKKNRLCNKKCVYVYDNLYYCKNHGKMVLNNKKREYNIKKIKNIKCTTIDPQILCENMYKKLDEIEEFRKISIDTVYIENQPSLMNPTMKTISIFLFAYFISKGFKDIKFIAPSNKLKLNESFEDLDNFINLNNFKENDTIVVNIKKLLIKHDKEYKESEEIIFLSLKYFLNKNIKNDNLAKYKELFDKMESDKKYYDIVKELAIKYTKYILNSNEENKLWLNHLEKYDKKDDLCDAFLHGYKKLI